MNIPPVRTFSRAFTLIELLVVIAIIGILSAMVLASLSSARQKGDDAKIKTQLSQMRSAMETYASLNNNTYGITGTTNRCGVPGTTLLAPWTDTASGLANLGNTANWPATAGLVCVTSGAGWAATAKLSDNTYWCMDAKGTGKNVGASPTITASPLVVVC